MNALGAVRSSLCEPLRTEGSRLDSSCCGMLTSCRSLLAIRLSSGVGASMVGRKLSPNALLTSPYLMVRGQDPCGRAYLSSLVNYRGMSNESEDPVVDTTIPPVDLMVDMVFSGWSPPAQVMKLLQILHESGGLSWSCAIGIVTVALRLVLLPTTVLNHKSSLRTQENDIVHRKLMDRVRASYQQRLFLQAHAQLNSAQQMEQRNIRNQMNTIIYSLFPASLFITHFFAISNMLAAEPYSLKQETFYWVNNLVALDPTGYLPIINCSCMFVCMLGLSYNLFKATKLSPAIIGLIPVVVPIALYYFTRNFAALYFCYWIPNTAFTAVQMIVLQNSSVRKLLGIPKLSPENTEYLKNNGMSYKKKMQDVLMVNYLTNREYLHNKVVPTVST